MKLGILHKTLEATTDVVIETGLVVGDVAEATVNITGAIVVTALTVVAEIGPSILIVGALVGD